MYMHQPRRVLKFLIINPYHSIIIYYIYTRDNATSEGNKKRGPQAVNPTYGPRLGDGPIFEVTLSQVDVKKCRGITYVIFQN